jgi:hypothetical protein
VIELIEGLPDNVVGIVAKGRVTKKDRGDVLIPAIEKALEWHHRLRLYYEIRARYPGAAWEEVGLGIGQQVPWERVAIVSDVAWIRHAVTALPVDPERGAGVRRQPDPGGAHLDHRHRGSPTQILVDRGKNRDNRCRQVLSARDAIPASRALTIGRPLCLRSHRRWTAPHRGSGAVSLNPCDIISRKKLYPARPRMRAFLCLRSRKDRRELGDG